MGFWKTLGRVSGDIPGVARISKPVEGLYDVSQGNWGEAGKDFANFANPTAGVINFDGTGLVREGIDAGKAIKDAYDEPFDEKRAGYDAVIARAEELKKERMARQDSTYAKADAKYRPAREALSAVYGDPKSWKL